MKIKIANKNIGEGCPTFVIAEGGLNHNGDVRLAKKIVENATNVGADAIKFQTFVASDLVSSKSKAYKLFRKLELSDSDFSELNDYAKSNQIIFLSTPFGIKAVNLLIRLKVPAFKIASGDLTNLPLISYIAKNKKPIFLSTGMGNIEEVNDAVQAIKNVKNNKIIIMHSVTSYPTPYNEVNLRTLTTLKMKFKFPVGYSDNGSNDLVTLVAVTMGSKVIEKHFTINKKLRGPDHKISADPKQMKNLIMQIRQIEEMFGTGIKKPQPSELRNLVMARRSIHTTQKVKKNSRLTSEMIAIKRPAVGILPKFYDKILGKKTKRNLLIDEPIKWSDLK